MDDFNFLADEARQAIWKFDWNVEWYRSLCWNWNYSRTCWLIAIAILNVNANEREILQLAREENNKGNNAYCMSNNWTADNAYKIG